MNDDTISMEAVREPLPVEDPWSVQTWSFRDETLAFGYVTVEANHPAAPPDKPWLAYLTAVNPRQSSFTGWFATAEEAKAYIGSIADYYRQENAEARA